VWWQCFLSLSLNSINGLSSPSLSCNDSASSLSLTHIDSSSLSHSYHWSLLSLVVILSSLLSSLFPLSHHCLSSLLSSSFLSLVVIFPLSCCHISSLLLSYFISLVIVHHLSSLLSNLKSYLIIYWWDDEIFWSYIVHDCMHDIILVLAGLSGHDLCMSVKACANKNHCSCCLQLYISIEIDIIYIFQRLSCEIPFADNPGTHIHLASFLATT